MKVFRPYSTRLIFVILICLGLAFALGRTLSLQAQDTTLLGSIALDKKIDMVALAPNTGLAYGIRSEGKTLSIFDLKTYIVKNTIKLDRKPTFIAVDPSTNIVYVTAKNDKGEGLLYTYDSNGKVASIPIPREPQGIAIDSERKEAVIALGKDKQLLILELDKLTTVKTITLPQRPRTISLDDDSSRAVVVAGEAEGEGKQDRILVIDLSAGTILQNINIQREIEALSVDAEKDAAVAVSKNEVNVIDINTGTILATFKADDAEGVDINQSTHTTVITGSEGYVLHDLNSSKQDYYPLGYETKAVSIDRYRNTALLGAKDKVVEVQLPNPVPTITNIAPKFTRMGDPGVTLKVEGERFITTSIVKFNNSNIETVFKNDKELEAFIPASLITEPGTASITVTNPLPMGGTSEPYPFIIQYPTPLIASLSPDSVPAKSPDFTLTVAGSFVPGNTVIFNSHNLQTAYGNATTLTAVVPSSLIQTKGVYPVAVMTPDGQSSNLLYFTITDTLPVISGFSPTEGPSGTLVTIVGANFSKTPTTVSFNGTPTVVASLSDAEIKVTVPPGAKTGPITVKTAVGSTESSTPFTARLRQNFALSVSPQSLNIPADGSASVAVSLVDTGGEPFTGLVRLAINSGPQGITGVFNPEYISLNQSSLLTLSQASSGSITVQGTSSISGTATARTAIVTLNQIAAGTTILRGQVLASKDANPIPGVIVKLGSLTVQTDSAGNFLFTNPPLGSQVITIDGDTANHDDITYPSAIPVAVNISAGSDNVLPYPIFLHEVKTNFFTQINPLTDTIVTDPEIPNYEMFIPAGTVITGLDGQPNTKVSVKPVPIDRVPISRPPDGVYATEIYMYYFFKPGGGTPSQPIPVKMPNNFQADPGTRAQLWYYDESFTPDANSNQWKPFGMGTVSSDGRNIIPDPGVGIPKFCCGASFAASSPVGGPSPSPPDSGISQGSGGSPGGYSTGGSSGSGSYGGGGSSGGSGSSGSSGGGGGTTNCKNKVGDPVDPYSGMFTYEKDDIGYPAPSNLTLRRYYDSGNTVVGSFGRGTTSNFNHNLQGSGDALTYIPPEGGRYIFSKNADGSFSNINYPFLRGVRAYLKDDGTRTLKFKNGDVYTFDTAGRVTAIRSLNDYLINITRDGFGNITGLNDSFGRAFFISSTNVQVGSSIFTLVERVTDAMGRQVGYAYDSLARLTSVIMPDGSKIIYSYSANSRLASITNPRGYVEVTNQYDSAGRVISQTHADGGIFKIDYSVVGGIVTETRVTEPNGGVTIYRFNGLGYRTEVTNPYGQKTTYGREFSTNNSNSVTDPLGRTTTFTYDSNGNTTSVTDPGGHVTTYEYHPIFDKPTKITDAIGNVLSLTYDEKGNLINILSPKSELTTIEYNENGLPISILDALGNTAKFEYDEYGNLVKTTDPLGNSAKKEYDAIGRLIKATDPTGKTNIFSYDDLNRIKDIVDALNNKSFFTYDENGNLLTVTDAKNRRITYSYNSRDKMISMIDQLGKTESYNYDQEDNLISVTDRKGQTTSYTYDLMKRITSATYTDGSSKIYTYDAIGRLIYINDSISGPIEYIYGNTGCAACGGAIDKIIKEITPLGSISYTYDALGRRESMTVAGQPTVAYLYDANSRLREINAIINGAIAKFDLQHDALGRRTSLTVPNGVTTAYGYDNASRLLNLNYSNSVNEILESISYTYDANSVRTSMSREGVSSLLPGPAANITYNQANQLLTFNDKSISYNENGNITSVATSCGTTTYTWNARNKLVGIDGYNSDCSALSASFKYDAIDRRIEKTVNGQTIRYLYDGLDIVQEITGGTVTANYIQSLNIDEPLVRLNSDGTVRFYQADALGSIIALTDENGIIKTQYAYDPFGNVALLGAATDNALQYTARENDGTGLYYYRARYYSPELQRFISEDPIGLLGGINKFGYVANNPVNFIDPKGKSAGAHIVIEVIIKILMPTNVGEGEDQMVQDRERQDTYRRIDQLGEDIQDDKKRLDQLIKDEEKRCGEKYQ